jgi:CBS domain-containing protein
MLTSSPEQDLLSAIIRNPIIVLSDTTVMAAIDIMSKKRQFKDEMQRLEIFA